MSVEGTWNLSIFTPIGKINAVVALCEQDGILTGVAHGAGEEAVLADVTLAGDRLTWKQAITKPMRLNLTFDVTANDDTLQGTAKAGRLPSSKVTGERQITPEHQA
ncbi:hypothetical protein [Streptomyces flaveolus]|uniref:hypothetical protein n=1 Tax=Streptomyces flaveolus TaxID=67297 RepID=UPI00166FAB47|nr:hypothetical protein [Streptomyces flaveolus]GGQ58718.1 hypothetical protein GCM10010216_20840 [Streptomyces flaveolus]